jgi:membrane peptidoglycan carboxypeptidase
MQTVKNLFLSNSRTISRKLQELFLSWYIDDILIKDRILELYLNIIEFGPGIFGIRDASYHYFAKDPSQLTLLESTFLASLLPAPVDRYQVYCQGTPSENYTKLIHTLLRRTYELERIDQNTYQEALTSELRFNPKYREPYDDCKQRTVGLLPMPLIR